MSTSVSVRAPLDANQRLLAIGLVLGVTLVAFETTAVITALPTIADELGGDSLYGVALASYTLADLVALVASGMVADRLGPRRPFLCAIAIFVTGLVVAGTADSMVIVVLGRTLQGAGTGGFAPLAYMLVKRAFPDDRQATMYAWLSAGWVLPSIISPAFAGYITDHLGWEWVFLSIIPVAVVVGVIASKPMGAYGPNADVDSPSPRRLLYALGAATGVGALVVGLQADHLVAIVGGAVGGVALALPMIRRLMPAGLLTARHGLPAILACRVMATAAFLGVDSFIPLAADRIHGASARVQGFVIVGSALSWTAGQALMSRRAHVPPRTPVRLGFALLMLGTVLVIPVLWAGWPLWITFFSWMAGGLGMGILFNPTTLAAMSFAPPGREGNTSGQMHFSDALGFSLMGGIGGATVAIADRTALGLRAALGINFALAITCAIIGLAASRGVKRAG